MRIPRTCKVCGKKFIAIKTTQFFCCRRCFKKDFYQRNKDKNQENSENPHYPTKTCLFCEEKSQLDFDPVRNPERFNAWGCPHCGATNKLVWEHQNNSNSYQIISNILISIQSNPITFEQPQPQYQPFYLPIMRPGQGNPGILVMTCETLSIADMQKKNRKKLLFS